MGNECEGAKVMRQTPTRRQLGPDPTELLRLIQDLDDTLCKKKPGGGLKQMAEDSKVNTGRCDVDLQPRALVRQ